jgi:hypothetical protein
MDTTRHNINFYIRATYTLFLVLWILLILVNSFQKSSAAFVLLIPFVIFIVGFSSADEIDRETETDVFKVTFINAALILSLPLLKLFNDSNKKREDLNHVIYLAIIFILLSYYHIWVPLRMRCVCHVIQSCLETFAITLYIYALTIFFLF